MIEKPQLKRLGLYELKQDKLWFHEECFGFLDQRKQAKMRCYKIQIKKNLDNLNGVRCEASRHFRNKKDEYLIAKIDEL